MATKPCSYCDGDGRSRYLVAPDAIALRGRGGSPRALEGGVMYSEDELDPRDRAYAISHGQLVPASAGQLPTSLRDQYGNPQLDRACGICGGSGSVAIYRSNGAPVALPRLGSSVMITLAGTEVIAGDAIDPIARDRAELAGLIEEA
jgi:hypothetical protein